MRTLLLFVNHEQLFPLRMAFDKNEIRITRLSGIVNFDSCNWIPLYRVKCYSLSKGDMREYHCITVIHGMENEGKKKKKLRIKGNYGKKERKKERKKESGNIP